MKLADKSTCTACMACIDACAHQVLGAKVDSEGYFTISVNQEVRCVECGMCTKACPVLNENQHKKGKSSPYVAWNMDSRSRALSASGGVFAAVALSILNKGGVVYGAAIEGFDIRHKRITMKSELPILQGSKYQHSDLSGIYRLVRKDLQSGCYVLFSGLGCQIAGLLSFLGKTNRKNLYTVDTICGGLSTMLPMIQLKDSGKYKGIQSFRDKENGWQSKGFKYSLKMICLDGSIENLGLDNPVLNIFSSKLLKRSSCLDCKFTGFHRISDCTIGDFWGDKRFMEQHSNGLSVLIIHDKRIMDIIHDTDIEMNQVAWKEIVAHNPNLYWTHQPLIQYFRSRKTALQAMKRDDYVKPLRQIKPWSVSGLFLRSYLKANTIHRNLLYKKVILNMDKEESNI